MRYPDLIRTEEDYEPLASISTDEIAVLDVIEPDDTEYEPIVVRDCAQPGDDDYRDELHDSFGMPRSRISMDVVAEWDVDKGEWSLVIDRNTVFPMECDMLTFRFFGIGAFQELFLVLKLNSFIETFRLDLGSPVDLGSGSVANASFDVPHRFMQPGFLEVALIEPNFDIDPSEWLRMDSIDDVRIGSWYDR